MPRSIIKGFDPNNVEFEFDVGNINRASIVCQVGGFRYHIWVNARTLELGSLPALYKNPIKRSLTDRVTRKLSVHVGRNADLVAAMQKAVRDRKLVEAALARIASDNDQRIKDSEEHARLIRIRDAAVPLYEALKSLVAEAWPQYMASKRKQAEDAIKLADEGNEINTVQSGELTKAV